MGIHAINNVKIDKKTGRASVDLGIDFSKTENRVNKAQYLLDSTIMDDMVPFMPMRDGLFIATTRAMSQAMAGTGVVVAAAPPFGRFLYHGNVMVDPITKSPWARRGAEKVVTNRPLKFSKAAHPQAQAYWFDVAKKKNMKSWRNLVDKTVNDK